MKCTSSGPGGLWRTLLLTPQMRSTSAVWTTTAVALAVVATASCGTGERDVGTSVVYDSAGATIVENRGPEAIKRQLVVHSEGDATTLQEATEEMVLMELGRGSIPASKPFSPTIVWTNRSEMAVRSIESGPGPYAAIMRRTGLEAEDIVTALGYEDRISPVLRVSVGRVRRGNPVTPAGTSERRAVLRGG